MILDDTYTPIATVTSGGDLGPHQADMHESAITSQGTMLLTSYPEVRADLSSLGGPKDGWVLEGVVQEVDIATGAVVFEWRSLDHVPVSDTYQPFRSGEGTQAQPFDYFHLNSVQDDGPDHILISARHTHAVYELDRATGPSPGGSVAGTATSRSARGPRSPGSTTPGARPTGRSPCSTTRRPRSPRADCASRWT